MMALGVPWAAWTAYLLRVASKHRVDQLDPMGQAGGDHTAWAVGRPDALVQVACLGSRPREGWPQSAGGVGSDSARHLLCLGGVPTHQGPW